MNFGLLLLLVNCYCVFSSMWLWLSQLYYWNSYSIIIVVGIGNCECGVEISGWEIDEFEDREITSLMNHPFHIMISTSPNIIIPHPLFTLCIVEANIECEWIRRHLWDAIKLNVKSNGIPRDDWINSNLYSGYIVRRFYFAMNISHIYEYWSSIVEIITWERIC